MEFEPIKKSKNKFRKIIGTSISILALVITLGVSYSMYTKSLSGHDTKVVAGDIYMRYANGATKEVSMVPSNTYNEGDYYEFSINGKNTSDKDIVYDIVLNHGENYNNPYIRLNDKFLRFRLVTVSNNVETEVIDKIGYDSINNTRLYVSTIAGNGSSDVNTTYRLYTWVEGVVVGNVNQDYTTEQWSNVYTNINVSVTGDFANKSTTNSLLINFDTDGGDVYPSSKAYSENDTYGNLPIPTKEGYMFIGWYKESTFNTLITSSTPVTSSGTIYAKFLQASNITLDKNDGTTSGTESIKIANNTNTIKPDIITLPTKELIVSGFTTDAIRKSNDAIVSSNSDLTSTGTLDGYYTDRTNGYKVLASNTSPTLISNVTNYTDASGNWIKNTDTTLYARFNTMPSVTLPTITKTGYNCGFTESSGGTTIQINSGSSYIPTNNTTLYGVCEVDAISNVSFTATSNSIYVNDTTTTSLTYSGTAKTIAYASNNTAVATVNSSTGVITGVGAGNATITVTLTDYENNVTTRSVNVTVSKFNTTMTINPTSGAIAIGTSTTTTVTTNGDGTISCTTSNSSIATCSFNSSTNVVTINGLTTGTASITIKQSEGANYKAASDVIYSISVGTNAANYIKSRLGNDGLVAVDTNGDLYNGTGTIREYRYSGGENDVKNYIWFNNESWRIIGVFNNEIKIMRDEELSLSDSLKKYVHTDSSNGTSIEYNLKYSDNTYGSDIYWSYPTSGTIDYNWAVAGLQYYLNDTNNANSYWSSINQTFRNFIKTNATYYVGFVSVELDGYWYAFKKTPQEVYSLERTNTHIGNIALIYPSDWGYASETSLWNEQISAYNYISRNIYENKNWIKDTKASSNCFISRASSNVITTFMAGGTTDSNCYVSPALYLNSNTVIISGNGTSSNPYKLI